MGTATQTGVDTKQERGDASGGGPDTVEREVRLLTATKVPAGHQKLITGKVTHQLDEELLLFTPSLTKEKYCCLTVWWRRETTNL